MDFNYVRHHPLWDGYELYLKMPYDRPTWDLASVLMAVRPKHEYFGMFPEVGGHLMIGKEGYAVMSETKGGGHRLLTVTDEQIARVREALIMLVSEPPPTSK